MHGVDGKSKGQQLVERVSDWVAGYMSFTDASLPLVVALWCINTWVFERFDATPYLCVTAGTKGAGKTRLMELCAMLSRQGRMFGDMTPATMFRLIEAFDSKLTIFFDEAEKLSSGQAGVLRSVMNTGYRQGQKIARTLPGGVVKEFPVYCPKCFALIGDVTGTLRDRSIVIQLERGTPERDFDHAIAEGEASALVVDIRRAFAGGLPSASPQDFLSGRDREIWAALFGVAESLRLDGGMMDRLVRAAADLTAAKLAPGRRYVALEDEEGEAVDSQYAERALKDLRSVLNDADGRWTGDIFSSVAVERMKAIPSGPWRGFKGKGLDEVTLASLLSRFGVHPSKNAIRMERGEKSKQLRGYSAKTIKASAK